MLFEEQRFPGTTNVVTHNICPPTFSLKCLNVPASGILVRKTLRSAGESGGDDTIEKKKTLPKQNKNQTNKLNDESDNGSSSKRGKISWE